MSRIEWVLGLVAIAAVGLARIRVALNRLAGERKEVEDFAELFARYIRYDEGDRLESYGRLLERSYRIQELLGPAGVLATYIAPFRTHVIRNYDIILNALPALHRDFQRGITRSDFQPFVAEALVRYMGLSEDSWRSQRADLRNPVAWFREGIGTILLVPVWVLQSLGLWSRQRSQSIAHSGLFRFLRAIAALIGVISALVAILDQWDHARAVLLSWIHAWRT